MKKTLLFLSFLLCIFCIGLKKDVKADYDIYSDYEALREYTNNYYYNSITKHYDLAQKDLSVLISQTTNITILTPGLGSGAETWSNDTTEDLFIYRDNSLIEKINQVIDSNIYLCDAVYIGDDVNTNERQYQYAYYDLNNYSINNQLKYENGDEYDVDITNRISANSINVTKHLIIIYQNNYNFDESIDSEYFNFLNGINQIIYKFKDSYGVLPKINLIGHSRGGLINFKFMLEHPDMIDNFYSLGTPYLGSFAASIIQQIPPERESCYEELADPYCFSEEIDQFIDNQELYSGINIHFMGSEISFYNVCKELRLYLNQLEFVMLYNALNRAVNFIRLYTYMTSLEIIYGQTAVNNLIFLLAKLGIIVDNYILDIGSNVIHADGFVSTDSQLCMVDDIEGSNIKRYTKKFNINNYNSRYKSMNDFPAIGHNMQTQDVDYINYILINMFPNLDDYIYEALPNNCLKLTLYTGSPSGSTLYIPSTVIVDNEIWTVTEIGSYAFTKIQNDDNVEEIIISNTVKKICSNAFSNLKYLQSISTASNSQLTTIENYAFNGCDSLSEILFPNNVQNYNIESILECRLLVEAEIANILINSIDDFSCNMISIQDEEFDLSNNDTLYLKINSSCKSSYLLEITDLNYYLTDVVLYNSNLELINESLSIVPIAGGSQIGVDLDYGCYYLCLSFISTGASFNLSYGLDDCYDAHEITINETKDMMEHYHDGYAYANFTPDSSGYYYINVDSFLDNYSIGQNTIKISHIEGVNVIVDFLSPEDGGSFTCYFDSNISYLLEINNLIPSEFGNEALYHLLIKIVEYKDLNPIALDSDNCYYASIDIGDFNYNAVYKFEFNSYVANQFSLRLVDNNIQNFDVSIIAYDKDLQTYDVLFYNNYYNNQLITYNINTNIDKTYFICIYGLRQIADGYIRFEVMPLEYYVLSLYNDPIDGGMEVGTEVSMHNGNYGGRLITEGYNRILYVKYNNVAISRLQCYFESSDETLLRVSKYGTVTALRSEDGQVLTAYIKVILKADHSIVNTISFNIVPETLTSYIYCTYGMDVRNGGVIQGTEVTEYGALPIPANSYPIVPIHVGYTRLLCMGNDAPSLLLQDYVYEIDYCNTTNGLVEISQYGTILGVEAGRIGILCIYKYNPIYRVYVELDVY